jgi:hypothetical protein
MTFLYGGSIVEECACTCTKSCTETKAANLAACIIFKASIHSLKKLLSGICAAWNEDKLSKVRRTRYNGFCSSALPCHSVFEIKTTGLTMSASLCFCKQCTACIAQKDESTCAWPVAHCCTLNMHASRKEFPFTDRHTTAARVPLHAGLRHSISTLSPGRATFVFVKFVGPSRLCDPCSTKTSESRLPTRSCCRCTFNI